MRRLLIRPGAIGDCILCLPAIESLRADYTEVWVAEQNVPLIRFADRVRSIGSTGIDLVGLDGVAPPARALELLSGFDSIISWYGYRRPEFRFAVQDFNVRFFPALPPAEGREHAVDFFLSHAREAGGREVEPVPRIDCPLVEPGGYIAILPFSGSPKKNWPLERFRALADFLSSRMPVKWCAGPEEALDGATRMDNLLDLALWLKAARAYVGNDSGVTHLAAAVGVPTVAIFGPTDPKVWGPRGLRTLVIRAPGGAIENMSFQTVLEAVESVL